MALPSGCWIASKFLFQLRHSRWIARLIKNPTSNIAKAVLQLKSRYKLTLTGTPLENTTLDLWSQMTFINPGLLGGQTFFKNEYQGPIEKKRDEAKTKKLNAIIKRLYWGAWNPRWQQNFPKKWKTSIIPTWHRSRRRNTRKPNFYYRHKILTWLTRKGLNNSRSPSLKVLPNYGQLSNHPRWLMLPIPENRESWKTYHTCWKMQSWRGTSFWSSVNLLKHLEIVKGF